eukprot:TRINITY_DN1168_c0_g1_i1.p1 TRINITY_DN1168_c0_g1~~TRINITY_DN1168_c0_g1_i1.p1  ORF type:complete len:994 (-),score=149.99 TRINITY_DN1168_c0_g1_i1:12-2993(-)
MRTHRNMYCSALVAAGSRNVLDYCLTRDEIDRLKKQRPNNEWDAICSLLPSGRQPSASHGLDHHHSDTPDGASVSLPLAPSPPLPNDPGVATHALSQVMVGVDCEMVELVDGTECACEVAVVAYMPDTQSTKSAHGRTTAKWQQRQRREVLLHEFIEVPVNRVGDWRTQFTGLTAAIYSSHAASSSSSSSSSSSTSSAATSIARGGVASCVDSPSVPISLTEARRRVVAYCRSRVVVGHSVLGDLHVLGFTDEHHHFAGLLDTAELFPHADGPPSVMSLASVVDTVLGRTIQRRGRPHSPVEDAHACAEVAHRAVAEGRGLVRWRWVADPPCFTELTAADVDTVGLLVGVDPSHLVAVYLRGSRGIGTAELTAAAMPRERAVADWDFVVVVDNETAGLQEGIHLMHGNVDVALYCARTMHSLIRRETVWIAECLFAPPKHRWLERIDFTAVWVHAADTVPTGVWLPRLRTSVRYEASRKWGSAKRRMLSGNAYAARKHVFIALRFLTFGVCLASNRGRLDDISCANHLWEELLRDGANGECDDWESLNERWLSRYRALSAEFKCLCPKVPRHAGARVKRETEAETFSPSHPTPLDDGLPAELDRGLAQVFGAAVDDALHFLRNSLGIQGRRHEGMPWLVQLRYMQGADPHHPWVSQARGVIMDTREGHWQVVARPLDRFFSLGERGAASLDWSTVRVQEKMDGSLATLYHYEGEWHVATSRIPDGSSLMCTRDPDGPQQFSDMFWRMFRETEQWTLQSADPQITYMFEMCSPRHVVVVRHPVERLWLVAARRTNPSPGSELDVTAVAHQTGWRCVPWRTAPNGAEAGWTADTLLACARDLDGALNEGFVAVDAKCCRVKVKSPEYVRLTHLFPVCSSRRAGGGASLQHLLQVILASEQAEFRVYCPELAQDLDDAQEQWDTLVESASQQFQLHNSPSRRQFASRVHSLPLAPVLFDMYKHSCDAETALRHLRRSTLWRLFDDVVAVASEPTLL